MRESDSGTASREVSGDSGDKITGGFSAIAIIFSGTKAGFSESIALKASGVTAFAPGAFLSRERHLYSAADEMPRSAQNSLTGTPHCCDLSTKTTHSDRLLNIIP